MYFEKILQTCKYWRWVLPYIYDPTLSCETLIQHMQFISNSVFDSSTNIILVDSTAPEFESLCSNKAVPAVSLQKVYVWIGATIKCLSLRMCDEAIKRWKQAACDCCKKVFGTWNEKEYLPRCCLTSKCCPVISHLGPPHNQASNIVLTPLWRRTLDRWQACAFYADIHLDLGNKVFHTKKSHASGGLRAQAFMPQLWDVKDINIQAVLSGRKTWVVQESLDVCRS